ncbi:MAG: phosphoglycerate kinase [Oligoflexales bacterium]
MKFNRLEEVNLEGKAVLVRLDLNVPLSDGKILDDTRIQASLPTLRYLQSKHAKIAIMSHLGRPKGKVNSKFSLEPVGERLAEILDCEVVMVNDYHKEPADQVLKQLGKNQIMMFENLRFHAGETANDSEFAQILIKGVDFYVNDAFGAAHRSHASVVAAPNYLPKDHCFPGYLMTKEIEALDKLKNSPKVPFTVAIGGAKVSDKIGVILSLIEKCNHLLIGGAMAYTLLKYKGFRVGTSKVEEDKMDLVEAIFRNAESRKVAIELPIDHVCAEAFESKTAAVVVNDINIPDHLMGLDIGPQTIAKYREIIKSSSTVLWNGPMGVFEWDAFAKGTTALAEEISECAGYTVLGGGESVAAAQKAGVADKIKHVSTGGGASLEYLEGAHLPGIKALELV